MRYNCLNALLREFSEVDSSHMDPLFCSYRYCLILSIFVGVVVSGVLLVRNLSILILFIGNLLDSFFIKFDTMIHFPRFQELVASILSSQYNSVFCKACSMI